MDDAELLRRYARDADQAAFATLVERRLPLVYSAALRQVGGDAHLARDVAQTVFADLARKAAALAGRPVLTGWLYTSTSFAAAKIVRGEQRRRRREQEAQIMQDLTRDSELEADWEALRPVIDAALSELGEHDREAVLLRFFENRGFGEIGARLRIGENGARMRVERALDKLHAALARRGIRSSAAALGTLLAAEAVVAAPTGLATAIAAAAPVAATAGAAGIFMSVTKLQWAIGTVVLTAGALGGVVQYQSNRGLESDVGRLRAQASEIQASQRPSPARVAVNGGEQLRTVEAQLAETQARLRERNAAWQKLQLPLAAPTKPARSADNAGKNQASEAAPLDALPRPVQQDPPQYPVVLREFGIGGRVQVNFIVGADGNVVKAMVVSSTHSAFDEPALAAVSQWKFDPGRKGGRPVNTRLAMDVVFTPREENGEWF